MSADPETPLFRKNQLPAEFDEALGGHAWGLFRKTATTQAIRIDGPFRVETSESENEPFFCEDGWLAIDARGYPYAIASEEFELIYTPVEADPNPDRDFVAEAEALVAGLTAAPFRSGDGSDDPNRHSLVQALGRFIADRKAGGIDDQAGAA